jgi:hypothetical protein
VETAFKTIGAFCVMVAWHKAGNVVLTIAE